MLDSLGPVLIADGMNAFGFSGHEAVTDIVSENNVMTVYASDTAGCEKVFTSSGIGKTEKLITAWDTFDATHPGEAFRYEKDGISVFDIPSLLRDQGLYLAERRGGSISLDEMVGKVALCRDVTPSGNEEWASSGDVSCQLMLVTSNIPTAEDSIYRLTPPR